MRSTSSVWQERSEMLHCALELEVEGYLDEWGRC